MKVILTVALFAVSLCGCRRMPNALIIEAVKSCRQAGLVAEPLRDADGQITGIQCAPPSGTIIQQSGSGSPNSNIVGGGNVVVNGEKVKP